jgi:hypothetical protein
LVFGEPGQVRALGGLPRAAALDRGGVGDPHVVGPQRGVAGQRTDQPADRIDQLAQPLVVAGLFGQIPEQMPQVPASKPQPAGLAGVAQQAGHHRQRHQLGIADLRHDPHPRTPRHAFGVALQQIIDTHIECRREGVQVRVHDEPPVLDVGLATPILDTLTLKSHAPHQQQPLESLIQ